MLQASHTGPTGRLLRTGRGRGLLVTEDAPAGTLLLLCHPLSVLSGPTGTPLAPSQLVSHFERSLHTPTPQQHHRQQQQQQGTWVSSEQRSILDSLFDGSGSSAAAPPLPLDQLAAARLEPSPAPASNALQASGGRHELAAGRLQRIMEFNCKGERCCSPLECIDETLMPTRCQARVLREGRGQRRPGRVAVQGASPSRPTSACSPPWPSSTTPAPPTPAAAAWRGGAALAVRSSVGLTRGEEVQISYLGRYISAPASTRQELLRHSYGFTCGCGRCVAECGRAPLSDQGLHRDWARLDPFLRQAVMAGLAAGADPRPLRDLGSRLLRFSLSARAAVAGLGVAGGRVVARAPDAWGVGAELQQRALTGTVSVGAPASDGPEPAAVLIQTESSTQLLNSPAISSNSSSTGSSTGSGTGSSTGSSSSSGGVDAIGMDDTSDQLSIAASDSLMKESGIIRADAYDTPVVLAPLGLLLLMAAPPGSYSHCALCVAHLALLQASLGADHPLAQRALTVAIDAHVARYGETAAAVCARLMEAHEVAQQGLGGAVLPGK
ncbi:MAG: hypothetical protein WDW38_010735 [Sanguina aurantia]